MASYDKFSQRPANKQLTRQKATHAFTPQRPIYVRESGKHITHTRTRTRTRTGAHTDTDTDTNTHAHLPYP